MKIYLIEKHFDNTYDYDDDRHQYSHEVIACTETKEKAKDFIKNYNPGNYYKALKWIEGDPENKREKLEDKTMLTKMERIFHVKYATLFDWYELYHILWLTITEMEVI